MQRHYVPSVPEYITRRPRHRGADGSDGEAEGRDAESAAGDPEAGEGGGGGDPEDQQGRAGAGTPEAGGGGTGRGGGRQGHGMGQPGRGQGGGSDQRCLCAHQDQAADPEERGLGEEDGSGSAEGPRQTHHAERILG